MAEVRLGPIGRRVLVAFLLVAVTSVAVLVLATVIGVDLSRVSATQRERAHAVEDMAFVAGLAYVDEGQWTGPLLAQLAEDAEAADAHFIVVAPDGAVVYGGPVGQGFREKAYRAPVRADGQQVGTAYLAFRDQARPADPGVTSSWLLIAAAVAMVVALLMAVLLTRRLTSPLVGLTDTARQFAGGDRGARAAEDAPGELGVLARTFNEMADEVTRAEQARRHLSADVAHELRTPLTSLQGGLEELAAGQGEADRATLTALHAQAVRLGRVVSDLAELAQAEASAPSLRLQDVELADLVRSGLAVWEAPLRAAGLVLRTDLQDGVWARADADRIHQVIGNLLVNAARHGHAGAEVTILVRVEEDEAVLQVADTGPGIPAEDVPHAFDRFWRGDPSRSPGSGLGLPVARALVEAQGGRIALASTEGVGTTVTLRLPLAE